MPFKSKAQRGWMYANHPEMAKRWEKHTPKGKKLPEKVKSAFDLGFEAGLEKQAAKWFKKLVKGTLSPENIKRIGENSWDPYGLQELIPKYLSAPQMIEGLR